MGGLNNPRPTARKMPNRFFKYRWASYTSKEGAINKKKSPTRQNFIARFVHSTFTVRSQNNTYSGYN